ncbi:MAG: peptidoglycan DD-metalloendopeptidase family protein [Geminicoccaceae bacterium]
MVGGLSVVSIAFSLHHLNAALATRALGEAVPFAGLNAGDPSPDNVSVGADGDGVNGHAELIEVVPTARTVSARQSPARADADIRNQTPVQTASAAAKTSSATLRPSARTEPSIAIGTGSVVSTPQVETAANAEQPVLQQMVTVRSGDTLAAILERSGIDRQAAHQALTALSDIFDPRRLQVGEQLTLWLGDKDSSLTKMRFDAGDARTVELRQEGDTFVATMIERPLERRLTYRSAAIQTSIYEAAGRAGVPSTTMADLLKLFSWDVDFQRDVRTGDDFELLYDVVSDQARARSWADDLHYGALRVNGDLLEAYRFDTSDGRTDYYDRQGRALRKFLLRTPIDGARISSGYGMRRHPILGYNRMHKGIDFAAPTGTPIYAAGDGTVAEIGRKGAYGNYIRIRHDGDYSTAYAHMARFANGLKRGARVKQGQQIGRVGATGRVTGPHLHYEVLLRGQQMNPLKLPRPPAVRLTGNDLVRFQIQVADLDRQRVTLATRQLAANR